VGALRTVLLIAATVTTGLTAGVFGLYAHTVMPGLRHTDDRTFIAAFQALDRAIVNPWFLGGGFLGALLTTGAAAAAQLAAGHGRVLVWTAAAFVLYLVAFVVTVAVHLPLNDALKAAGDPDRLPDPGTVRARFDAARWERWNLLRAVVSTVALACLAWALVLHGRVTS
jgi:uncharacterized membrane protein